MTSVSAARGEAVSGALELRAERAEVVDLAVVRDDDAAVLVRQRLSAGLRQIDDRQTAIPEPDARIAPDPLTVGPAVRDRVGHPPHDRFADGLTRDVEDSGDPAHQRLIARTVKPLGSTSNRVISRSASSHQPRTSSSECRCA